MGTNGHLTHVTLAQTLDVPDDFNVSELHSRLSKLSWSDCNDVDFLGYYHKKQTHYNGIEVKKSEAIQDIHDRVCTIHDAFDLEVYSSRGENYKPH